MEVHIAAAKTLVELGWVVSRLASALNQVSSARGRGV